jgi:hypothetical protein
MLSVLTALLLFTSASFGQEAAAPTLNLGDRAPVLGSGEWIKGDPVEAFESGRVYVIHTWATWSAPSTEAVAYLTELQRKYEEQGLVVIGQNLWETDAAAVRPLVEEMDDEVGFRVVLDEPSGREGHMARNWMAAAGRKSIPCAFVVDQQGRIAWIGHPMKLEPVLKKVLAGSFDPKAEAEKDKQIRALEQRLNTARRNDDTDEALRIADEIVRIRPELAMLKFEMLRDEERWDEAYAFAEATIPAIDDAAALNELAWRIVDPEDPYPSQNLDVALKAASRANELTDGRDPMILDTFARACWLNGEKAKALELQQKAVENNTYPQFEEDMADRLRQYRSGQQERQ